MPLKLPCPKCGNKTPLSEPLPLPGSEIRCTNCTSALLVSYPPGVMQKLKDRGKTFAADEVRRLPAEERPPTPHSERKGARVVSAFEDPLAAHSAPRKAPAGAIDHRQPTTDDMPPTTVDPTMVQEPVKGHEVETTVASARSPYGALPGDAPEPDSHAPVAPQAASPEPTSATEVDDGPEARALADAERTRTNARTKAAMAKTQELKMGKSTPPPPPAATSKPTPKSAKKGSSKKAAAAAAAPPAKKGGCVKRVAALGLVGLLVTGVAGLGVAGAGYYHFSQDLPTVEALQNYNPSTVTEVYDKDGELLGEIYEQRRYVTSIEEIPKVMQDAFIAAEDDVFWEHGGVDWLGLVAAVFNEVTSAGSGSRGASTITMQVTRNFLLTKQKTYERKIREILLAQRLESTYTKEHILFLYLNEIYLGSGAYGVEAAARTYFGKHIQDVTLAEAAMIAGLAPAPSTYSPHQNFDKAKTRQEYVLSRMLTTGKITQAEHDAAKAEKLTIAMKTNDFLTAAPHFTEYARRYLVEKYGHDAVYEQGLKVTTTCDLSLQQTAQVAVREQVYEVGHRMGFRREAVETLKDDAAIAAKRAEVEQELRKQWATEQDAAGRTELPSASVLEVDRVYTGVVLEVKKNYARVGVGDHEAIVPIAWSDWVFQPNPRRSWNYRTQTDLTEMVDTDGDYKKDEPIVQKGDVVGVKVLTLSTQDKEFAKDFRKTPGEDKAMVGVRFWQDPEVEAALLSFDVSTGAVRSMVGGSDFEKSELNRTLQSYRQVGSTFKPIVYAAAINSKKVTTATMVTDGPLAFSTDQDFIWKPANYGHDYLGNITLRRALALSRNTCTVRVLDAIDPGMNDDVIYSFARSLGIGGPPLYTLPEDHIALPDNDHLCPWTRETKDSTICMDRNPPKDPDMSNTRHRQQMGPDDVYMCRSCDLSMGLGSASLTMAELLRAYSAFPSGGKLVEPYFIEEVRDIKGAVLEKHEPKEHQQVIEPEVAAITTWLLQGVVQEGTAARAGRLGLNLGGKTGTTNDEKDAWFVGFSNDVITGVWVGYDQPRSMGVSSTGGKTALPIWMKYMEQAVPKEDDRPFPMRGDIEWASIEETTGRRVTSGGRRYPFLRDTVPESTGIAAGQVTTQDFTEL